MKRALAILAGALVVLVLLVLGLRTLARSRTVQLFSAPVARIATTDSVVALTFDDGPTERLADSLIAILRSRDVRATFFLIGREVAAAPEAARSLVAAGHELGNHSYTHRRMILRRPSNLREEIERTDTLLRSAGMRGTIHFRPPYAYKLVSLPYVLWRMRRTTVTWDVEPDSYPEVAATPDGIVRHVLERVRPGSIVLLHPWYPSRATSLAAVPLVIDSLRSRGYRFATVGELLARRRGRPRKQGQ